LIVTGVQTCALPILQNHRYLRGWRLGSRELLQELVAFVDERSIRANGQARSGQQEAGKRQGNRCINKPADEYSVARWIDPDSSRSEERRVGKECKRG